MTPALPYAGSQFPLREMKLSEHYESIITLLIVPRAARVSPPRTPEEEDNQEAVVRGLGGAA